MADLVRAWRYDSGSTVFIYRHKVAPPLAALANSTMIHTFDFDDTVDASALHTFVDVLPPALATAESVGGVDRKKLIGSVRISQRFYSLK